MDGGVDRPGGDLADAVDRRLGEPQVAVRAERDGVEARDLAGRGRHRVGGVGAGGGDAADAGLELGPPVSWVAAGALGEPEGPVRPGHDVSRGDGIGGDLAADRWGRSRAGQRAPGSWART